MVKKCYVVTSLCEDLDENTAEVNVIKVVGSRDKAEELLLQLKEELIDNYNESLITDYGIDEGLKDGYIIVGNKNEIITFEYHESEVDLY